MPTGAMLTKKGCKHRFILPVEDMEDCWKCSWCRKQFASSTELYHEWDILHVPYKIREESDIECIRNSIQKYSTKYRNRGYYH